MISYPPTDLRIASGQPGATIYTPHIPIWFDRFNAVEEPDPDFKVDPSDLISPLNWSQLGQRSSEVKLISEGSTFKSGSGSSASLKR